MRQLVDADSADLLTSSTGGDVTRQAKSFPAAAVPAAASWYTAVAGNVGPKARRVGILGGHTRVSKSVDDREVEAYWECGTQHVGRTKAISWVENTCN